MDINVNAYMVLQATPHEIFPLFSGTPTGGQRGEVGQVLVVVAGLRQAAQQRVRAESQGDRRIPQGEFQGTVQVVGESHVQPAQPLQAAGAVAEGPLHRG